MGVSHDRARLLLWLSALTALGVSWMIYQPHRYAPFDFVDFSEFLVLLQRGSTFGERLRGLVDYYAGTQGRLNIIPYIAIAAKWSLWGDSPVAWQWIRFITMWTIIVLTYRFLRALGLTRLGAVAGASIFLFAPPAVDGWTRLTMGEPVGTVVTLALCLAALADPERLSVRRAALLFGVLAFGLVLWKEMMVVCLFLPLALAAWKAHGETPFWRSRRVRWLVAASAVGSAIAMVPVAIVALRVPADAYASDFGTRLRPLGDVAAEWTLGLIPFSVGTAFPPRAAGLAFLAFVALIAIGWIVRLGRGADRRRQDRWILAIALAFPLIGALEYLPWPSYNRFYALPFLLGGSLAIGYAMSAIQTHLPRVVPVAAAVWTAFLVFAGADAAAVAERQVVRQHVNRGVVDRLSRLEGTVDTVFLATEQRPPSFWQGIGPTLQRYGEAVGHRMPTIINETCDAARARAKAGTSAAIFYVSLCPNTVTGDPIVARYKRLRLPSPRPLLDSIRVDIVVPKSASKGNGHAP